MRNSICILIMVCISLLITVNAQPIVSYGFQSRIGTYEEINGGTIVGASLLDDQLENIAFDGSGSVISELKTVGGISIGFNFTFNDQIMNQFVISSQGYVVLGKDEVKIDPNRGAFLLYDTEEGKNNVIGIGINTDVVGTPTTEISYKTIGAAPDRVLVVQFKNWVLATDSWGGGKETVNLQIRLYETSNNIEFVFKNWKYNNDTSQGGYVGLKGNDNDLHLRYSDTNNWNNTLLSGTSKQMYWKKDVYPADGLTYTFTIPSDCEKPSGQPSELKLTASSINIEGNFKATSTADHYLTIMTEEQTLTETPLNGQFYQPNDKIGNGTVIAYDTNTDFKTVESLLGTKSYYFHLFAVNSFCSFGPLYNTTHPLTGMIKTLPERPQGLETGKISYENIDLSATANSTQDKIIIAITDEVEKDVQGYSTENGVFGTPTGVLNVGDKIEGGGTIVYKGEAKDNIMIEGLTNNNLYHCMAWSMDDANNYSSTSTMAVGLTWARLPYKAHFDKMCLYEPPFGWDITGFFSVSKQTNDNKGQENVQLYCNIAAGNPTLGKINTAATQWILLGSGTNRVILNYNMTTWARVGGSKPYNDWHEKDSLEIQVSSNGTDYTTIYLLNKENATPQESASDWNTLSIPFDKMAGEKVKVRLRWKTYAAGTIRLFVENFNVEEKPDCDYPVNVSVDDSSIIEKKALISWVSTGEENAWDIRFRKVGTDTWCDPIEVRNNPYMLTTLPESSNVELQVRAKCSLNSFSPWSKPITFATGYRIPFTESFDEADIPSGWSFENGILSDFTEFCTESIFLCPKNWMVSNQELSILYSARPQDWIHTPRIDLGNGNFHSKLEFDLKLAKTNTKPAPDDIYFAIIVSKDGGTSFRKENVVKEWKKSDFETLGDSTRYSIDLSQYTGIVKFGFYAACTQSSAGEQLSIDNVAFLEACPAAVNATVGEVTAQSATVTWEGTADEWLTFVRKTGETQKEYKKQTGNKMLLSGLTPKTNYEVGITKSCAANDTARIIILPFTTLSLDPCLIPANIVTTPLQQSVSISWSGEASGYNIKFRQVSTPQWIIKTTQTNSITIDGLSVKTEYEYTLQSVCSAAEGDTSQWTPIIHFSTLAVSCFTPSDINVIPTHRSATVSWTGEADNYQIAYRKNEQEWIQENVINNKSISLNNLIAATGYNLRLRSICAVGDTSVWSSIFNFKTLDTPICGIPINLRANGVTDHSMNLMWDANESNLTWDVRYREGSVTNWNFVNNLSEKSHSLTDLTPNTAYIWSVKATCDEERTSAWAIQGNFTTEASEIKAVSGSDLKIYVSNRVINIQNPRNIKIDRICLYGTSGQLIKDFSINSDENIWIPTDLNMSEIIIKIFGKEYTISQALLLNGK